MKTALVTGGAGFIGSHMADKLLANKYHVIILDNLKSGKKINIPKSATFIKGDVTKKEDIERVFRKHQIDVVFHIAGQASTITSFMRPRMDVEVNFLGTMNMVLACLQYKVHRFLYASSMTVYGHPHHVPTTETDPSIPISYYGITKFAAERFVHASAERPDLSSPFQATSFRMFNVYGPRQSLTNPYQGVMAIFIGNVLRNEEITIFGDGNQARDFVYIDDVVNAWVGTIDNKKSFGKIFNLGFGEKISINNLIEIIITTLGRNLKKYPITYKESRPGDQRFMQADIRLAEELINFKPKVALPEGIKTTIAWAQKA